MGTFVLRYSTREYYPLNTQFTVPCEQFFLHKRIYFSQECTKFDCFVGHYCQTNKLSLNLQPNNILYLALAWKIVQKLPERFEMP